MIGPETPVFPAAPLLVPPVPVPPEGDLPLLRFLATVGTNGIGMWPRAAYETPVQRRTLLGRARITVSDPDAVRRVLVENADNYARSAISIRMLRPVLGDGLLISEGAPWRHQRRTLAPAFTPRAVEMLAPHIRAATDGAIRGLETATGEVDLFGALQTLALEIAGRTMFSVGMTGHGAGLRALVEDYQTRLGRPRLLDFLLPLGWPSPHDIARARFRRRWTTQLDRIIADRSSARTDAAQDLLDLLGAARDPETGRAFTPEELRDQVATLILAGHETTALTLLWACTLLAQAPGIQESLAAEAHVDSGTGDPMKRLPLTRAVVDETLRLYPPAYILARLARGADRLAGHDIAPRTIVIVAPWLLHRHRTLWTAPDAFDPSRFLPGAPAIPRFAYLPFGAGPRVCIGAQFALTEAVLALSRLVGRFQFALAEDRPVLPAAVVTLQPDHAPVFRLTPRTIRDRRPPDPATL